MRYAIVIGGGEHCLTLLDAVGRQCTHVLDLDILGLVTDRKDPAAIRAKAMGIEVLPDQESGLKLPGVNVVMLMIDDPDALNRLYRTVPPGVVVIDRAAALKLCELEDTMNRLREEIQEKKDLQQTLLQERLELQRIMDYLPDGVLVLDGDNRLEWINARFQDVTGIKPEILIENGKFHDPFKAGPGENEGTETVSLIEKVKETGQPVQFIHFDTDGEQRYYRVIITPLIDEDGRVSRIVETVRPITDIVLQRRTIDESERRFRQFIENARDMITIKDQDGRYLVINGPAASLFGKNPEDYFGRTDHELFSPKLADILTKDDRVVIEDGSYTSGTRELTVSGEKKYLNTFHFPLLDYKGDPTGVCSITRDVTEQHLLQKMAIQSEKMAAVGKLAASVAHEINNPLTGVLSFAEEMRLDAVETNPDDPIIADYDVIIRETIRCREIVSRLLDYARLDPTENKPQNVNVVIERALALVRKQAVFHDIKLTAELAGELPETRFIPSQIQQVLLSLLINAAEALNYKGKISVGSALSEDGGFVEAYVRDNGPGIASKILNSIFEPFFSTKTGQGTGQGLSIAKTIMDQHDGEIEARNNEDAGATFTIRLPVDRLSGQEKFV